MTPQQKKRLSYAKDRRNMYGEHDKGSRKTIQKNKLAQIRKERRSQDQRLRGARGQSDADQMTRVENEVRSTRPRRWKKFPDIALGEVVPQKIEERAASHGAKLARRKARNARQSHSSASMATIAEYFRIGVLLGLVEPKQAVAWADRVIACEDDPRPEIIEVAWSIDLLSTIDALAAVPGERDKQAAGRWLLGLVRETLPKSVDELEMAAQRAMQIVRHAELGDEPYYRFDRIDEELSLVRTGAYGSVDQCRADLLAELAGYANIQPVLERS